MNYGYIYKTTNLINNKVYIGQKKGALNSNYFGSGLWVKRALNKYGKVCFMLEIVTFARNKKQLDDLEKYYIAFYRKLIGKDNIYNIASGGEHSKNKGTTRFKKKSIPWNRNKHIRLNTGRTHFKKGNKLSQKTKDKISLATKGEKNPFFGKKHSPKTMKKIKKTFFVKGQIPWNRGKKHSLKSIEKMRLVYRKRKIK